MNFEMIVRQTAERLGLRYKFGPLPYLNQVLDEVATTITDETVCLGIQVTDGTYLFDDGPYYRRGVETQRMRLAFCHKTPLDYDPTVVEALVADLKDTGLRLIAGLEATGAFTPIGETLYTVMFDAFDANLVVVLFEFDLAEKDGFCFDE